MDVIPVCVGISTDGGERSAQSSVSREDAAGRLDVCGHVTLALALLSEVGAGTVHVSTFHQYT